MTVSSVFKDVSVDLVSVGVKEGVTDGIDLVLVPDSTIRLGVVFGLVMKRDESPLVSLVLKKGIVIRVLLTRRNRLTALRTRFLDITRIGVDVRSGEESSRLIELYSIVDLTVSRNDDPCRRASF